MAPLSHHTGDSYFNLLPYIFTLCMQVLGGESYLNFMGNEFGHPEWIDFPRVDRCGMAGEWRA